MSDALIDLGTLLSQAGATPTIREDRPAPSTLHDMTYHILMIAHAMNIHSKEVSGAQHILALWLKMLQFVVARPVLVGPLREYVAARSTLLGWSRMPRGYLGDRTHDSAVEYLIALGVIMRAEHYISSGPAFSHLTALVSLSTSAGLFVNERRLLEEVRDIRPTIAMLEGL